MFILIACKLQDSQTQDLNWSGRSLTEWLTVANSSVKCVCAHRCMHISTCTPTFVYIMYEYEWIHIINVEEIIVSMIMLLTCTIPNNWTYRAS